jgi:ketosteroid isomerase-like protein
MRDPSALEDAEAIRNLKARYAALCDNQYDADGIAMLFTEDALWESPGLGRFEGREAIRGFFRGASGIFSFAIHRLTKQRSAAVSAARCVSIVASSTPAR